ncbi:hypothetical protein D3C71_1898540 [compost metagenome]
MDAHRADEVLVEIDAEDIGVAVEIEIVDQGRAGQLHQVDGLVGLVAKPGDVLHVLARLDPPVFDAIEKKHQLLRKTPRLRPVKTFTHFLTLIVNKSLTY